MPPTATGPSENVAHTTWRSPKARTIHLNAISLPASRSHTLEQQTWPTLAALVEVLVNADDPRHPRTGPDAQQACELCTARPLALLVASQPAQHAVRPSVSIGLVTPMLRRPVNTAAHASRARHKLEQLCAAAGWPPPRPTTRPAAVYSGQAPQVYSYGSIDPTALALLGEHIDEFWLPGGDIDAFLELEQAAIDQHGPRLPRPTGPTEADLWQHALSPPTQLNTNIT